MRDTYTAVIRTATSSLVTRGALTRGVMACKTTGSTSAAMLRSCEKVVRGALCYIGFPGPRCFALWAWA